MYLKGTSVTYQCQSVYSKYFLHIRRLQQIGLHGFYMPGAMYFELPNK